MNGIPALCAAALAISMVACVLFWQSRNARRKAERVSATVEEAPTWRADLSNRIEQQLAELDRLIAVADEEITRLEDALAISRRETAALTASQQQQCFAMWEAGFTVEEIAERLATVPHQVQMALDEWQRPQRRAA